MDSWRHAIQSAAWQRAVAALRVIDSAPLLHGSRATGLAHADSDVDVLTSVPLESIMQKVASDGAASPFTVLEHVHWAKVPRLILRHNRTGTEVDAICRAADPHAAARDEVVRACVGRDPRVQQLA